jgi:5-methylcytosine-specific restriction endonuclease McrA
MADKINTRAGGWKASIGWDEIDIWFHTEGKSYKEIRTICLELCGSAPALSTLSNRYNEEVRAATRAKNKTKRATLIGLFSKRLSDFRTSSERHKPKPKPKSSETSTWNLFRIRIKDFKKGVKVTATYAKEYLDELKEKKNLEVVSDDLWLIPCEICGEMVEVSHENSQDWALDHRIPKSEGGSGDPDNLAIVHASCNQIKTNHTLEEIHDWARKVVKNNS